MRITDLEVQNFLSFDHLEWKDISLPASFVAGPNGVGKTNLIRALRALVEAVSPSTKPFWASRLIHLANPDEPLRISADVVLQSDREVDLLVAFLSACLSENLMKASNATDYPGRKRLSSYLLEGMRVESAAPLLKGKLIAECDHTGHWFTCYQSLPGEPFFRWQLDAPFASRIEIGDVGPSESLRPMFDLWAHGLPDSGAELLNNAMNGGPAEPGIPDLSLAFSNIVAPFLLEFSDNIDLPSHRAFLRRAGLPSGRGMRVSGIVLWQTILRQAIILTDNVRVFPRLEYSPGEASLDQVNLQDGQDLAKYLYLLKNGGHAERQAFDTISATFRDLTGRKFHVGRKQVEPGRAEVTQTEEYKLSVETDWGDVDLKYGGAGLAEALFLSAVLLDDERIVLLDEPASNLSPSTQKRLLGLIQDRSQAQTVAVTHSPYMIPRDILSSGVRFYMDQGATRLAKVSLTSAPAGYVESITHDMGVITDARAQLFSDAVILVEGPSESGAYPVWWGKEFGASLESKNIVVYEVGGKTAFGRWVWYLSQMHVPWTVVCDGDAIGDSGTACEVDKQLVIAGIIGAPATALMDTFATRVQKLGRRGVFTSAATASENFESVAVVRHYASAAGKAVGKSKAKRGRWIADRTSCPPEVVSVIKSVSRHLGF